MKKILFSLASVAMMFVALAQNGVETYDAMPITELDNSHSTAISVADQQPLFEKSVMLFTEDFSNGYDGNNGFGSWSISNTASALDTIWKIAPEQGVPPGFNGFGSLILNAPTSANGYAWFDLWGYNSLLLPDWVDISGTMTSPALDFSTSGTVIVEWTQRFAYCCFGGSPLTLDVSTDNGLSWTSFAAEGTFIPDANTNSGDLLTQVDISCIASGESSVLVRWGYDVAGFGGYGFYSWAIDDIEIFEAGSANDLAMNQITNGDVFEIYEYTLTPISQAITAGDGGLLAGAIYENRGALDQTNCVITVEITDVSGNPVSTTMSDPFDLLANANAAICPVDADTMYIETGWVPSSVGQYNLTVSIASDQTDDDMANNSMTKTIYYTECAMGHDDIANYDVELVPSPSDNAGLFLNAGMGNMFTVANAGSDAVGMSFRAGPECDSELEVEARLYEMASPADLNDGNFPVTVGTHEIEPFEIANSLNGGPHIYIEFDDNWPLTPGFFYFVAVTVDEESASQLTVQGTGNSDTDFSSRELAQTGDGDIIWFPTTSEPSVRLIMDCDATGLIENVLSGLTLEQNVPNPVVGNTVIRYTVDNSMDIMFEITDLTGKIVYQADFGRVVRGTHNIQLDQGTLGAGVYQYSIISGGQKITKKMVVAE